MTEFVIVIPVVLLTCFTAIQTVVTAQAAQLADYAAFAAARSYATEYARFQRDPLVLNPAKAAYNRAWIVACMIVAPVSTGLGDESPAGFQTLRATGATDRQSHIMQGIMEGLAVAFVYRIERFTITGPANPNDPRAIIEASFDYMLPVLLPGFNDIWLYIQNRADDPTDLRLENIFETNDAFWVGAVPPKAEFEVVLRDWKVPPDASFANDCFKTYRNYVNSAVPGAAGGAALNLRIPARCAMGFEPLIGDML